MTATKKRAQSTREVNKIVKQIRNNYNPEKIILFGSYAWGKPTEDSDVDLFIIKKSPKRRIDRARELRAKLIGNKFPPMDLLIYTPEELDGRVAIEDFFIKDVLGKGKVLYAK